ncbi:MAG TPA: exopolysaccharide biosynthesis protein [Rhodanobacteraceae bacterium]|nr:exopolysaccharide biosynthesis protein [Rhodanobacteraceae bacterium]
MTLHQPRTTELLTQTVAARTGETITLGEFIEPLGERAFGFLLLALALPNFIPAPIGVGGAMGVLVILVGLQMLIGLEQPWLPATLRRRGLARKSVQRFIARITPLLRWLEHISRPRWERLAEHPAHRLSGLLLIVLGAALALPIPFTNYPFGLVLLAFAVALIERDGALLVLVWVVSIGIVAMLFGFSHVVLEYFHRWL